MNSSDDDGSDDGASFSPTPATLSPSVEPTVYDEITITAELTIDGLNVDAIDADGEYAMKSAMASLIMDGELVDAQQVELTLTDASSRRRRLLSSYAALATFTISTRASDCYCTVDEATQEVWDVVEDDSTLMYYFDQEAQAMGSNTDFSQMSVSDVNVVAST